MLLAAVIGNLWAAFPGAYITWEMTVHTGDVFVHDKCPHAAGLPECTGDARASSAGASSWICGFCTKTTGNTSGFAQEGLTVQNFFSFLFL